MNFALIGSIGAYTRALKMEAQWKQKSDTKNYTGKAVPGGSPPLSDGDFLKMQLDVLQEGGGGKAGIIYAKLSKGKKLSSSEMAYLKEKDPEAYMKAKEIEAERTKFQRELKDCKTKEDFQRLKALHISASLSRARAIANDPNISKGKKMELLIHENAKLKAVVEAADKFVQDGGYHRLPWEEERKEDLQDQNPDSLEANREEEALDREKIPVGEDAPDREKVPVEEDVPDQGKTPVEEDVPGREKTTVEDGKPEGRAVAITTGCGKQDGPGEIHRADTLITSRNNYAKNSYREMMKLDHKENPAQGARVIRNKKA